MELADMFDVTDQFGDEDPTTDRHETVPVGKSRLLELQLLIAQNSKLYALVDRMASFNADELQVFQFLADRHDVGRRKYGPLDVENDQRDYRMERAKEFGDAAMYDGFQFVLETLKRGGR